MLPYHSCKLIDMSYIIVVVEKKGRGVFLLKDRKLFKAKKNEEEDK
jgi:hypothetical protein